MLKHFINFQKKVLKCSSNPCKKNDELYKCFEGLSDTWCSSIVSNNQSMLLLEESFEALEVINQAMLAIKPKYGKSFCPMWRESIEFPEALSCVISGEDRLLRLLIDLGPNLERAKVQMAKNILMNFCIGVHNGGQYYRRYPFKFMKEAPGELCDKFLEKLAQDFDKCKLVLSMCLKIEKYPKSEMVRKNCIKKIEKLLNFKLEPGSEKFASVDVITVQRTQPASAVS